MTTAQHFVFALVDDFTHLAFACAVEPLRIANHVSGQNLYRWSFASEDGATAKASNGSVTLVHHRFDTIPPCDRLFVLTGLNLRQKELKPLVTALRYERSRGRRIGAICSGAYVLAKAGFLDGMQAAIHWEYHDGFREEFPEVDLVNSVFVAHECFVTASGGSAATDLMLHLIQQDHGYDLAVAVADQMVYNAVRNGDAAQRVSIQSRAGVRDTRLVRAIELMRTSMPAPLSPSRIAAELGISARQLERLFDRHLQTTPKRYQTVMRLERAHHLLLQTEASIIEVALATGFESTSHFARVYRQEFGVSPGKQRAQVIPAS